MTALRAAVLTAALLMAVLCSAAAAQEPPRRTLPLSGSAGAVDGWFDAALRRERVHVSRRGRLGVRVGCNGDASDACRGVAVVRSRVRGRTRVLARRRFRVAPGRERVVTLRLRPGARRLLARRRTLRAVVALRPGGAQPVTLVAAR